MIVIIPITPLSEVMYNRLFIKSSQGYRDSSEIQKNTFQGQRPDSDSENRQIQQRNYLNNMHKE